MALAARDSVCSVTAPLPGSNRRSNAARLVCMHRAIYTLTKLFFSIACCTCQATASLIATAHNCNACVNDPAKACKCRLRNSASVLGIRMLVGKEAAKRHIVVGHARTVNSARIAVKQAAPTPSSPEHRPTCRDRPSCRKTSRPLPDRAHKPRSEPMQKQHDSCGDGPICPRQALRHIR